MLNLAMLHISTTTGPLSTTILEAQHQRLLHGSNHLRHPTISVNATTRHRTLLPLIIYLMETAT